MPNSEPAPPAPSIPPAPPTPTEGTTGQTNGAPAASPSSPPTAVALPKRYTASLSPGSKGTVSTSFAEAVIALEKALNLPVWLLVQERGRIDEEVYNLFFCNRHSLPEMPIALVIHSPGGLAKEAFQLAKLLRRRCKAFIAVVPRYAKSAATLLSLGANCIMLGEEAELGPLDAQILDMDRERRASALEEVQALERINAAALVAIDQTMFFLAGRTGKKTEVILPNTLKFVSDMMRPLLEKIDTVQYSQKSRVLKEAEEYATRLLQQVHSDEEAAKIAGELVEKYPNHGFAIDIDEAKKLGLNLVPKKPEHEMAMDNLIPHLKMVTAVGRIQELSGAQP